MQKSMQLVLLLSLAMAGSAAADDDAEKLDVTNKMIVAWNTLDWDTVFDLFAEDGILHSMASEPIVGRENIRSRLQYLADGIDHIELKIENMGIVDGVVFMERADVGTFKGRPFSIPVVGVLEIENGKVQEWREYYDKATLVQAIAPEQQATSGD